MSGNVKKSCCVLREISGDPWVPPLRMPTLREMGNAAPSPEMVQAQELTMRLGAQAPLAFRVLRLEQILNSIEAVVHFNCESAEARLARHRAAPVADPEPGQG